MARGGGGIWGSIGRYRGILRGFGVLVLDRGSTGFFSLFRLLVLGSGSLGF